MIQIILIVSIWFVKLNFGCFGVYPRGLRSDSEALSQYIARLPLSLKKIGIEENVQSSHSGDCQADRRRAEPHHDATMTLFTSKSQFFKGKTESFPLRRFLL